MLLGFSSYAQSSFETVMQDKISKIQANSTSEELTSLANDFERIASKESTQWLAYYYAAYTTIEKGRLAMRENKTTELDAIATAADKFIDKADAIEPNNSEIFVLKKMSSSLKMMVDPMSRYMSDGQDAKKYLAKAKALDANNPRVTLLEAEDTYFTPEQFGGSKTKGIELFKQALEQYKTFKTKSNLDPNWGKSEAEYFLSQSKP